MHQKGEIPCICQAGRKRRQLQAVLETERAYAFAEACAIIRHFAKLMTEKCLAEEGKLAFKLVSQYADSLEVTHLKDLDQKS